MAVQRRFPLHKYRFSPRLFLKAETYMKNAAALTLSALLLYGCDSMASPEPVNPLFASYSNIFGFEPIRGNVKSFVQQQHDEQGNISSSFQATLAKNGCFETLKAVAPLMALDVDLVKEGNYLVNRDDKQKRYALKDNCLPDRNLTDNTRYESNDKGFVTRAINDTDVSKNIYFEYDEAGFPSKVAQPTATGPFVAIIKDADSAEKKRNGTIQTRFKDEVFGEVTTVCEYDDHFNATSCKIKSKAIGGAKSMPKQLDDPETTKIEYY
jgi:hypothetical protein